MVVGMDIFREHFAAYDEHYVLIGGSAAALLMESLGLEFRATKDLDIVLLVESLNADFTARFWEFIRLGRYRNRQKSTGKRICYRFQNPELSGYPVMLELFSRQLEDVPLPDDATLTPLPMEEDASIQPLRLLWHLRSRIFSTLNNPMNTDKCPSQLAPKPNLNISVHQCSSVVKLPHHERINYDR